MDEGPPLATEGMAGEMDEAAVGRFQPGDAAKQRALAASARTNQRDHLVGRQSKIDIVDRGFGAKTLDWLFKPQHLARVHYDAVSSSTK